MTPESFEGEKGAHLGDGGGSAQPPSPDAPRPRVLVSRCLLGDPVRYDGRDKHAPALDALAAEWAVVPLCPELRAGLGVPRPPIDLIGPADGPLRVLDRAAHVDRTDALDDAISRWLAAAGPLDGAVVKARSPSCGIGDARRYDHVDDPEPAGRADGRLVRALRLSHPGIALIGEVGLADPEAVDRFTASIADRARARAAAAPTARIPSDLCRPAVSPPQTAETGE